MEEEETAVPPPIGFRFDPTDQQLILLLRRIILGLPLYHSTPITERNLYGGDPWWVFPPNDPSWVSETDTTGDDYGHDGNTSCSSSLKNRHQKKSNKKKKYIYGFVRPQNASKNRRGRTAGCGTWHGGSGKKIIYDQKGQKIGFYKTFVFIAKPQRPNMIKKTDQLGHWNMYEYSLDDVSLNGIPMSDCSSVLCKISKDDNKPLKVIQLGEEAPCPDQIATTDGIGHKRKQQCSPSSTLDLPDEERAQAKKKFCTGESSRSVEIDGKSSELASSAAAAVAPDDSVLDFELQQLLYSDDDHGCPAAADDSDGDFELQQLLYSDDDHGCSAAAFMLQNQSPTAPYCSVDTSSGVANQATSDWVLADLLTQHQISQIMGASNATDPAFEYDRLPVMSDVQPLVLIQSDVQQAYTGLFDRWPANMLQSQLPPSSLQANAEISQREELHCSASGVANKQFDCDPELEHMFPNSQDIEDIMGGADFDPLADDEDIMGGSNFDHFFDDALPAFTVQPIHFTTITIC